MSWNADYTIWTSPAYHWHGVLQSETLEHLGNGKWKFTTRKPAEQGDHDDEDEGMVGSNIFVLWEDGVLVQKVGSSANQSVVFEHTFSSSGSGVVYYEYGDVWPGHTGVTESSIKNRITLPSHTSWNPDSIPFYGAYNGYTYKIDIPEVNPDNPYTAPTGSTHRINVTARNVDHWSWSLNGGPDNMMPPGSTFADITIESGTEPEQLPNLTSPIECDHGFGENAVFNTGKGFSSVSDIEALIPRYPAPSKQFLEAGFGHQWFDTIIYGASQSLPELVELDSEGKITKFCLGNSGVDYQEDDDGPGYHYLYIFSNPLSLWVKAGTDGSKSATASPIYENSTTRWNEGWVTNNWGTTAPDLTKNHAIIRYWPLSSS